MRQIEQELLETEQKGRVSLADIGENILFPTKLPLSQIVYTTICDLVKQNELELANIDVCML